MVGNLTRNLSESYSKKAVERDLSSLPEWKQKERDIFSQYIKDEKILNLLEIGSGTGKDSQFFNELGVDTFSTDISHEMVKLCISKGLKAKVMSFENLEFRDNSYESIWSMNCLLHVPKEDIKEILLEIKRVLKPSGLFYMGVYGGENFEGIWKEDTYEPKRFFSFYENDSIKELLSEIFTIEYFNVVPKDIVGGKYDFQSIILRK
ncbi:MAG: class I SAM-dependent methyltransferase [Paenisporosarcina sp.]